MKADEFPVIDAYLRWARHQHETGSKTADELVAEAVRRYGSNPTILEALVREALRLFALEAITGRSPITDIADVMPETPKVRAVEAGAEDRARLSAKRRAEIIRIAHESTDNPVAKFFERHPEHAVTVPLLALTREELIAAASQRDIESAAATRRAMLCRRLADRLQPGQVAGDVFTEQEVERLAKNIMSAHSKEVSRRAG